MALIKMPDEWLTYGIGSYVNKYGLFGYACALAEKVDYSVILINRRGRQCDVYSDVLFGGLFRCQCWSRAFWPFYMACRVVDVIDQCYRVEVIKFPRSDFTIVLNGHDGLLTLESSSDMMIRPFEEANISTRHVVLDSHGRRFL